MVNNWTLFLDRDGVINKRIPNDYVKRWGEFTFLPNVLTALKLLKKYFYKTVVVTNQAGIGKGLMTTQDLNHIHHHLKKLVRKQGGRIDKIYHCPALPTEIPNCRKPGMDMGKMAKNDFPAIDFNRSIMVGDSLSDIQFGKNFGMLTVLLKGNELFDSGADYECEDLMQFYRIFVTEILVK